MGKLAAAAALVCLAALAPLAATQEPPPPPVVPWGFTRISNLAPNPVVSGDTVLTANIQSVLCTTNSPADCFNEPALRVEMNFPVVLCKFCAVPTPGRRLSGASSGCAVPVDSSDDCFYLPSANASLLYERSSAPLDNRLLVPSVPGQYLLECALQTPELSERDAQSLGTPATSAFEVVYTSPPPVISPPPPPANKKPPPPPAKSKPPPPPPKPVVPATCPSAAEYRALGGCRRCVAVDSPFMSSRGGSNRIRCVRPVTTARTATTCSDALISATLTVQTNNPTAPKLPCIPLKGKWITVGLPLRSTTIPFLTPQKIIKKSLRLDQGLLPVTDRNGVPISTVKTQNGVDRLFVTFLAPAGGMGHKRGKTVAVTGAVSRGGTGTFGLNWCFSAEVRVCSK